MHETKGGVPESSGNVAFILVWSARRQDAISKIFSFLLRSHAFITFIDWMQHE